MQEDHFENLKALLAIFSILAALFFVGYLTGSSKGEGRGFDDGYKMGKIAGNRESRELSKANND